MHLEQAKQYLLASFSPYERSFLFAQPDFLQTVAEATDDEEGVKSLKKMGMKLIISDRYVPPSTNA